MSDGPASNMSVYFKTQEWGGSCEQPEMQTLEKLLAAFDEEDPESARVALASPFIKHMDVEYARLAMSIPLPEAFNVPPKPKDNADAAASSAAEDVSFYSHHLFSH